MSTETSLFQNEAFTLMLLQALGHFTKFRKPCVNAANTATVVMAKHAVLSSGSKMWRSLPCTKSELRLDLTLECGQSFR